MGIQGKSLERFVSCLHNIVRDTWFNSIKSADAPWSPFYFGLFLKVFSNRRPLQQMSLEGSLKSHEMLQLRDFLWDFIKYFNARESRPPVLDNLMVPVVHVLYSSCVLYVPLLLMYLFDNCKSVHSLETILT